MENSKYIIIVSGLPRSGTSMIMMMLEAGGIPVLTDKLRVADPNNPNGYYEYERVKLLPKGDVEWLYQAYGKAVKIITGLVTYLPANHFYKMVLINRDMLEVLASQRKMLGKLGKSYDSVDDNKMASVFIEHLHSIDNWLKNRTNLDVLRVNYNQLIVDSSTPIAEINSFLGGSLDTKAMSGVINRNLYRERNI